MGQVFEGIVVPIDGGFSALVAMITREQIAKSTLACLTMQINYIPKKFH
jgi:hypothetical protein